MITKETYQDKIETELNVWSDRIEQLKAEALTAQAEATAAHQEQFNELAARQAEVAQKLQTLQQASGDQWEDNKSGVEKALIALGGKF